MTEYASVKLFAYRSHLLFLYGNVFQSNRELKLLVHQLSDAVKVEDRGTF